MTEIEAFRRLAMSSAKSCARLHHQGRGTDEGIAAALSDRASLVASIAIAHRLTARDVEAMAGPLVNSTDPAPPATPNDVEHVRFMNTHGRFMNTHG